MGNFYTNITLRTSNRAGVEHALRRAQRTGFISEATDNALVVFDQACETQDTEVLIGLATALSSALDCAALAVMNHDDSELYYALVQDGVLVDEYSSNSDFAGEATPEELSDRAGMLVEAFGAPLRDSARIADLLGKSQDPDDGGFAFEVERHAALVEALGLPPVSSGTGFDYLSSGEFPDGFSAGQFLRVG